MTSLLYTMYVSVLYEGLAYLSHFLVSRSSGFVFCAVSLVSILAFRKRTVLTEVRGHCQRSDSVRNTFFIWIQVVCQQMRTQGGQPAQKGSGRTMPPTAWAVAWDAGCEWKTLVDQRRGQRTGGVLLIHCPSQWP